MVRETDPNPSAPCGCYGKRTPGHVLSVPSSTTPVVLMLQSRSVQPSPLHRAPHALDWRGEEFGLPNVGPRLGTPTHRLPGAGISLPDLSLNFLGCQAPPDPARPTGALSPVSSGTVASPARGSAEAPATPLAFRPRRRPAVPAQSRRGCYHQRGRRAGAELQRRGLQQAV